MFAARSAATKGPRGSKNSPFVGRYETLDDSNPILYSRVLVPSSSGSKDEGTKEKKKRSIEEVDDAVPASPESAEDKDSRKELKTKKKKSKAVDEDVEEPQASKEEEATKKKKSKKEKKEAIEEPAAEEDSQGEEKKTKKSKKKKDDASDEEADDSPGSVQEEAKADDSPAAVKEKRKKKKDKESAETVEGKSAGGQSETAASEGKKRKKPRSEKGLQRQKQRAEARAERVAKGEDVDNHDDDDEDSKEPSAPKAERLIKGANTLQEEAQVMRERLGLVSSAPADSAAAEARPEEAKAEDPAPATSDAPEAAEAKPSGGFSFGFTVNAKVEQEMEDRVARLTGMVRNEEGQVVSASQPETDGRRVYVGGMPFSYDEASIKEYWEYCGELEEIDMMTFQDSGNFRGIVFLTFKTSEAAASALQFDGEDCDGKTLKVMPAHSRGKKGGGASKPARPQGPAQKTPGYNVLYVGNLAYEATEEDIKEHFKGCAVTKVRIHTDKDTGRPKGYAHVHVEDDASMDAAAEYDQSELQGRPIKVMFAQPKK